MDKIAFVFSGQGDQYPGMGKELYERYKVSALVYGLCDVIRPGTSEQCFYGTEEELKETKNTQPCLFATELAAANALLYKGIVPSAVAGYSLGEVTAVTFAGIFDSAAGFEMVCKRAELMQTESDKLDTFMAAILKLPLEQIEQVCKKFGDIFPVNLNGAAQIVVSGLAVHREAFIKEIRKLGGAAIPLKVKGAFHSPFMKDAADAFAEELRKKPMSPPNITVYSNVTASHYGSNAVELLSKQICSPVRWEELIKRMVLDGIDTFFEVGPGHTLTNMIKRIAPGVKTFCANEYLKETEECSNDADQCSNDTDKCSKVAVKCSKDADKCSK